MLSCRSDAQAQMCVAAEPEVARQGGASSQVLNQHLQSSAIIPFAAQALLLA